MKALLFTDPHLTDNPREAYRWKCFDLAYQLAKKNDVTDVVILGDLTDKKDNHSATLVNRIVEEVTKIAASFQLHILKGNHDYKDPKFPFFGFLNQIPNVNYYTNVTNPTEIDGPYLWLPHTQNVIDDWAFVDFATQNRRAVFMHQTINKATVSNGTEIESDLNANLFAKASCLTFSGDIHVPQQIRRVVYVGSPHPVHFGDCYDPRMVLMRGKKFRSLPVKSIRRQHAKINALKQLKKMELNEGDHLKVTYELDRSDAAKWPAIRDSIRKISDEKGIELFGVSVTVPRHKVRLVRNDSKNTNVFTRYCADKKLTQQEIEIGQKLMEQ